MGPEPLPRGQYPVSILFVIIQEDGAKFIKGMERCTSPFRPMEVPSGKPSISNQSIDCESRVHHEGRAGQS